MTERVWLCLYVNMCVCLLQLYDQTAGAKLMNFCMEIADNSEYGGTLIRPCVLRQRRLKREERRVPNSGMTQSSS